MTTKHLQPLTDLLREAGAKNIRLTHGGKHPRLVYEWQGRERFYVVSSSPGEPRAMKNALADLRRALRPIGNPAPEPRRIEQPAYQPRPPLTGWGDPPPAPAPMQTAMLTIIDAVPPGGFAPPPPAQPTGEDMNATDTSQEQALSRFAAAIAKPPPAPNPNVQRPEKRDSRLTPNSVSRNHAKVPYAEVLPLLDRAVEVTGSDRIQVLYTIGYSSGVLNDWERAGRVTLRTKYMLLGLLSTLEVPPPQGEPTCPWDEIQIILNAIFADYEDRCDLTAELAPIGHPDAMLKWRTAGTAPLSLKCDLLSLWVALHRRAPAPPATVDVTVEVNPFTFDETTALFGVLNGFPVGAGVRRGLIGKLAQELART